jgi:hypothetical protein
MTAIAGLVSGGKAWIGGDSAGVGGLSLSVRKDSKVFKNNEFVIGCTSSFRMIQLLQYSFTPPVPLEKVDGHRYMVTQFIPALRACFRDGGFLSTSNGVEQGGNFLVGWRGELYSIESDFQVAQMHDKFYACGCGEDLVLGSLFTTAGTKLKPEERITKALQAAERFSAGVRGPFTIESV